MVRMKAPLLVLAVAAALVMLLAGCSGSQPDNPQAPAQPTASAASPSSNGCPSPYDGTYRGTISDSGSLHVTTYDSNNNPSSTDKQFTASYDFEMTMQCDQFIPNGDEWSLKITHVKASHPIFDCANGCTPSAGSASIGESGSGGFYVVFPNGAGITTNNIGDLQMSQDGKTMTIPFEGTNANNGVTIARDARVEPIESYNCLQGGRGYCMIVSINPNTITLTKAS